MKRLITAIVYWLAWGALCFCIGTYCTGCGTYHSGCERAALRYRAMHGGNIALVTVQGQWHDFKEQGQGHAVVYDGRGMYDPTIGRYLDKSEYRLKWIDVGNRMYGGAE